MEFIQKELLEKNTGKSHLLLKAREIMVQKGFRILGENEEKPWGGFLVVDSEQIKEFKNEFFRDLDLDESQYAQKLSPKILLIAPKKRLSWQYHHRRSEVWKLIAGEAGIVLSDSDEQGEEVAMELQKLIKLRKGERHRLVGKNTWGIVAELWVHLDPDHLSDEDDIVRLEDDFARK